MRINQIAREHHLDNKDVIAFLSSIGHTGKSHSSSIDDDLQKRILVHFGIIESLEEEESQKPSKFKRLKRPRGWAPTPAEEREDEIKEAEPVVVAPPKEKPSLGIKVPSRLAEAKLKAKPVEARKEPEREAEPKEKPPVVEETKGVAPAEPEAARPREAKPVIQIEPVPQPKVTEKEHVFVSRKEPVEKERPPEPEEITPEVPVEVIPEKPAHKKAKIRKDTDEAIRKEIQKLKLKTKRGAEPTKAIIGPMDRRIGHGIPKGKSKKAWKRSKRERQEAHLAEELEQIEHDRTTLKIHEATTVADIANGLGITPAELISKLVQLGVMATLNQRLDSDTIQIIADEFGFGIEEVDLFEAGLFSYLGEEEKVQEDLLEFRPPVVTVMGHVDHGKTKLLDAIRKSDVVAGEAGGITQHIGAYDVRTPGGRIVFVDTPGHEAFTSMRARGAMITDIVVLVVAADDGVMPQTVEAIHHAKAAEVPIIVAVNKIDLPGANPDRVKQQLAEHGLMPEEWSGKTMYVLCSALKREGINDLLEAILLQAEMMELKANPKARPRGTILEARLEQGRGSVTTVLVEQGTLHIGDPCIAGVYSGRIRAMCDNRGEPIHEAGPSTPIEILGLEDVPSSGDPFVVVPSDSEAKQISGRLQQLQRERLLQKAKRVTLEDLHVQIREGKIKDLNLIVRGDVQGSVEALCSNLEKIESQKVQVQIIHSGVGAISESDIMLAAASNALAIGFNVRPTQRAEDLARQEGVQVRTYRIIYDAISAIRTAMAGLLDRAFEENLLGRGEIREVFRTAKGFSIAGSYVRDGRLNRNANIRILRDSVVVHEGKLASLRRFKDDVSEVPQGMECGIGVERFNDIRVGDVVECYKMKEITPTL
ncbi:MAG TPA: translation initiation factor IF-2 [bacterium]|nr:translation initiation factor IF-2 [bacterium]